MKSYLKTLFSESGEASFGRVGAFLALVAVIAWGSWIVYREKAMPPLEGPTFFITSLYGTSKLLSKGAEIASSILNRNGKDEAKS